ncbi:Gfo/Idh/MocA family protein [Tepidanaerobacter syntrophicus]|uniref:Gfo/Idh/MocA family protein n=1 Tax=Tepidanaerobacter syntrophicus TaxID=224999 RepID=UPI001BD4B8E0|nr:Gfo/Idh/MocA family oxidoreductase [Tepidanaerobacter syntrophicus]
MEKINIAVIGTGIYGENHVAFLASSQLANLKCICDINKARAELIGEKYDVKTFTDIEEMFDSEDIDAVVIATPDPFHYEPAIKAINAKKHVLIEKPMALSVEECLSINDSAIKNGVRVAVDFHKRWDPAAISIKNNLESEKSDKILHGYMSMDDIIDVPTKWLSWSYLSSPAFFLGVHCYDLIRCYMQCEAKEVYAKGQKEELKLRGIDTYDSIQAMITFENGAVWTVENSWIIPSSFPKSNDGKTLILGNNRYIRMDSQNRGLEIFDNIKSFTPNPYFINYFDNKPFGFGIQPLADFIKDLEQNKPFLADGKDGIEATRIAQAVHQSLEKGSPVIIDH